MQQQWKTTAASSWPGFSVGCAGGWGLRRESLAQPFPAEHSSPNGSIPPLAARRDGCPTPSCADQLGSCSMPRARSSRGGGTGMSLQMLRPGLEAKGSGFRGCSATPGQCRRPTPHFPPAPVLQLGTKPAAIIQAKHVNLADPAAPV